MISKTKLSLLAVLLVAALAYNALNFLGDDGPEAHTDAHEAYIGQELARLVNAHTEAGDRVTLVLLLPEGAAPYQSRVDRLAADIAPDRVQTLIWARDEGIYDDDDYTSTLDEALRRQPDTSALVVISAGGVTHAQISPQMRQFLDRDGALILNGVTQAETPFVRLAENGDAVILARRVNWLRDATWHPPASDSPEDHFAAHYTLLSAMP